MSFFHFSLLQVAALALLISCFCIKLGASPPPSLPSCSFFSPTSSWLSQKSPINEHTRNLTLFKQSSLSLLTDQSLSFTFTSTYSDEDWAPSLAFILVRSPQLAASPSSVQSMELRFACNREHREHYLPQQLPLHVCNPLPQQTLQIQALANCFYEQAPYHSEETEVSLTYDGDAAAQLLHVQAVDYRRGLKINQTFTLSSNDSLPDPTDSTISNESTTLFVGYITSGEATINVTCEGSPPMNSVVLVVIDDNNAYSGGFYHGIFVGINDSSPFLKKHRGHPSLVNSRPPMTVHGAAPLSPIFSP